jgi:hypothetical protein
MEFHSYNSALVSTKRLDMTHAIPFTSRDIIHCASAGGS